MFEYDYILQPHRNNLESSLQTDTKTECGKYNNFQIKVYSY